MKHISILFLLLFSKNLACISELVDLIVFSYNRPMQLYALLESVDKYMIGLGEVSIIYRASDSAYATAYEVVKTKFKQVRYFKQGAKPKTDFKPLVLKAWQSQQAYLMFATDDIVVKGPIDLYECVKALKLTDAYGFYLRLGKNITRSYFSSTDFTAIPTYKTVIPGINLYKFSESLGLDWRYPNTVDMTIYPKAKIRDFFVNKEYDSPNQCEGRWATYADMNLQGLFFDSSKIVNIPINVVNENGVNPNMGSYSVAELLKLFNNQKKIDISDFCEINNQAPHMDHQVKFIQR